MSREVFLLSFLCFSHRNRIDPLVFQFQFKNVEYSSGRNKTFLCYLVDTGKADEGLQRGYLEDEHTGSHAEEAFFTQCLPHYDPALKYTVTWYILPSHHFHAKIRNSMWVTYTRVHRWNSAFGDIPIASRPRFSCSRRWGAWCFLRNPLTWKSPQWGILKRGKMQCQWKKSIWQ